MDRLEDQDIGPLWAEHYPRRKDEHKSQTRCLDLCVIIKRKAVSAIPGNNNWYDRVSQILAKFGIPENQFWGVDNEIKME
jgi:hypothetical protein